MGFSTLDSVIVVLYLVGMAVVGVLAAGKQTSTRDYFLGNKDLPWWAVCFAIVATETSTLTFISIPGLAYLTNLNFLQVTLGYLLGRIVISFVLLPAYAKGELATAYQLLGNRFGTRMRNVASMTFMGTRILADGVRLFATAIPLAILLQGWDVLPSLSGTEAYAAAIIVLAAMTLTYTYFGGVRAVIWTDVIQMLVYLFGAVGALLVIVNTLPQGWESIFALPEEKFSLFTSGESASVSEFFKIPYTVTASLVGGAFLSMASHGTDQIIVQRLLTVRHLAGSKRALIGSGVIVIFQFALFLFIGLGLYAFYGEKSLAALHLAKADEIFPHFIISSMPSGLSGIIVAGLLAAAMSTLSGSINSLASATIHDIYRPYFGKTASETKDLRLSRVVSFVWCIILVGVALFFMTTTSRALVELALSIASVTYGALLGTFLLGVLTRRVRERDALAGFAVGIVLMALAFSYNVLAWTWFTFVGTCVTFLVGILSARLFSKAGSTTGMTSSS